MLALAALVLGIVALAISGAISQGNDVRPAPVWLPALTGAGLLALGYGVLELGAGLLLRLMGL